jgi:hypothetical protein
MKYPQTHWEDVAKRYNETPVLPEELTGGKTYETVIISKMQKHYPYTTMDTVRQWIRRCQKDGLL